MTIDGWQSPMEVSLQGAVITIPFLNNTYQVFSSSLKKLPDGCAPSHTRFFEAYENMRDEDSKLLSLKLILKNHLYYLKMFGNIRLVVVNLYF